MRFRSGRAGPARGADARGIPGLDWLNFFIANFQTGFGPFISVYLTSAGWTQGAIGAALSTGTIASMVSQVPAGALVDAMRSKRLAAAGGIAAIVVSALAIALWPNFLAITAAEVLHSFASAILGPAVAAITMILVAPAAFGERLGRNARYAALGNAVGAALMGACGYYLTDRAVFLFAATLGVPALAALQTLPETGLPAKQACRTEAAPAPEHAAGPSWRLLKNRRLLAFAGCAALFHLANAALLPIAAGAVTKRAGGEATLIIAACIVGPQIVTALLSPAVGRAAESWGRRPVLLLGFCAVPIRGLLLVLVTDPYLIVPIQLLDGLAASVFGVLFPLIVADLSRDTGYYTTSLGLVGLAIGGGATLSTTAAGLVADNLGAGAAFLSLGGIGLCATLLVWAVMPETKPASGNHMPGRTPKP
ncbi:MAG: MFS transporter [Alphaproteobacteria bacterium]|nr:MFS transporter [Alphaproteobacteria bacterium]